ncbi:hypothetical protein A9Q84_01345 [Halobacteriovorax marinus]|uniref:HTH cro/C1-type domain-containing protein n=1 Tax=Halobacteriovorax marinus TaxID=97084 RepID=A0A1Y5FC50_9BACT|nr:hypothetical protein A9Q84_01345 [Halobacteriovorax marinus]
MNNDFSKLIQKLKKHELSSGGVIRAIRHNWDFTLDELSTLTGIPKATISRLENNKQDLTKKYAERLAAALGVNPIGLMYPSGKPVYSKEIKEIEKLRAKLLKIKLAS